jgi:hypothetical protein
MSYFIEDSEPPSYVVSYGIETGILYISFRRHASSNEVLDDVTKALECLKPSIVKNDVLKVYFDGFRPRPEFLPSVIGTAIRKVLWMKYKAVTVNVPETDKYIICLTRDRKTYPMGMLLD